MSHVCMAHEKEDADSGVGLPSDLRHVWTLGIQTVCSIRRSTPAKLPAGGSNR